MTAVKKTSLYSVDGLVQMAQNLEQIDNPRVPEGFVLTEQQSDIFKRLLASKELAAISDNDRILMAQLSTIYSRLNDARTSGDFKLEQALLKASLDLCRTLGLSANTNARQVDRNQKQFGMASVLDDDLL